MIGLGIMGKPMAKNMIKAGLEVWVNNRSQGPMNELAACGAKAATRRELAENCDIILTMLPNGPQIREVMLGTDGVAAYMHAGQIFIDMSSISPIVSAAAIRTTAPSPSTMNLCPASGWETDYKRKSLFEGKRPGLYGPYNPGLFNSDALALAANPKETTAEYTIPS